MTMPRWLLPFTFGVDMRALEYVLRLAEEAGATLIPVSFVTAPPRGPRLEHIEQSKDFLEAVQHKAARFQVPLECYEVFTTDVLRSLEAFVHDLRCDGIVLITSEGHACLLQNREVKHLLIAPPAALVLICLPAHTGFTLTSRLAAGIFPWLHRRRGQLKDAWQAQKDVPVADGPLGIEVERHFMR